MKRVQKGVYVAYFRGTNNFVHDTYSREPMYFASPKKGLDYLEKHWDELRPYN